jgi:hypothetical protein
LVSLRLSKWPGEVSHVAEALKGGYHKLRGSISEKDVHPHLAARLAERGITLDEFNVTLARGWQAKDAKDWNSDIRIEKFSIFFKKGPSF